MIKATVFRSEWEVNKNKEGSFQMGKLKFSIKGRYADEAGIGEAARGKSCFLLCPLF